MTGPAPRRNALVQVLAPDYSYLIGSIADYQSVSVTWQRLGVGTGSVTVSVEKPAAEQLLVARDAAAPVVVQFPGLPRWEGRVTQVTVDGSFGAVPQLTATLVDGNQWFKKILAAPVPGSPWSNQAAAAYDTRTGPLETVAKAYISANVARLAAEGNPTPIVVVPAPPGDSSPSVTLTARAQTLQDLLEGPMRLHGYDLTMTLWLPGDAQPTGLSLFQPALVADVHQGRDQPYVRFTDHAGGVDSWELSASHPQAMGVVVGGPGELTDRVFQKTVATDGRVAALGQWGYPEEWLDATDADTADVRTSRALQKLVELGGTASVSVVLVDGRPWSAGPAADYWVGDKARAEFVGITVEDYIERVTATDSSDGFRVTPQFGVGQQNESPDARIGRVVAALRQRLAAVEARR